MASKYVLGRASTCAALFLCVLVVLPTISMSLTKNLQFVKLSKALAYLHHSPYTCLIDRTICESVTDTNKLLIVWEVQTDESGDSMLVRFGSHSVEGQRDSVDQLARIPLDSRRDLTWLARGALLLQQSDEQTAISLWRRVSNMHMYLIRLALNLETPEQKIRLYNLSLKVHPTVAGYYQLGRSLAKAGETDRGLAALREALFLSDFEHEITYKPVIYTEMGNIYYIQRNMEMARVNYQQALVLRDDQLEAIVGLALLDMLAGNSDEAVARLSLALDRMPGNPHLLYRLAQAYQKLGQLDSAYQTVESLIQIRADFAPAWRLLGNLAEQRGDGTVARRAYRQYLILVPDDIEIQRSLGGLESTPNP